MEAAGPSVMRHHRYLSGRPDAKGKPVFEAIPNWPGNSLERL
jgi:hypothetical protein